MLLGWQNYFIVLALASLRGFSRSNPRNILFGLPRQGFALPRNDAVFANYNYNKNKKSAQCNKCKVGFKIAEIQS